MVLGLMKRFVRLTSDLRVMGSTGTTWSLMPKYCDAFQNAACAVDGTILGTS